MSELSEANTIQKIPIPQRKSDVEAFLDDIFDRALDNNNNNNSTSAHKTRAQQQQLQRANAAKIKLSPKGGRANDHRMPPSNLQSRIKGGGRQAGEQKPSILDLDDVFSNNFNFIKLNKRDINALTDSWNLDLDMDMDLDEETREENVYEESIYEENDATDTTVDDSIEFPSQLSLPNKEYEYSKILKTFLVNKPYICMLNDAHKNSFFSKDSYSKQPQPQPHQALGSPNYSILYMLQK